MSCLSTSRPLANQILANKHIVSEAVALELRQTTGNIYIRAQIFTGFMYVAAALCMWGLRGWKIGQIEQTAMQQGKVVKDIVAAVAEPPEGQAASSALKLRSNVVKRMIMWKKV